MFLLHKFIPRWDDKFRRLRICKDGKNWYPSWWRFLDEEKPGRTDLRFLVKSAILFWVGIDIKKPHFNQSSVISYCASATLILVTRMITTETFLLQKCMYKFSWELGKGQLYSNHELGLASLSTTFEWRTKSLPGKNLKNKYHYQPRQLHRTLLHGTFQTVSRQPGLPYPCPEATKQFRCSWK